MTSDGGLVTSSAWFQPAAGRRPGPGDLRGRLHPLRAERGDRRRVLGHDYPGARGPPDPDATAPGSSRPPWWPTDRCSSGSTSTGSTRLARLHRGGEPGHRRPGVGVPDRRGDGRGRRRSTTAAAACGRRARCCPTSAWWCSARPTATSSARAPYADSVLALHVTHRHAWPGCSTRWPRPRRATDDFGATANAGCRLAGRRRSWGRGARTAPTTRSTPPPGVLRWSTNVVFGGSSGGFIGTTAYDGAGVYGATATR